MIDVSVIIPTKNEERTVGICIQKIKKVFKEYNINGEIIVSDNSTDNTPKIARSMGAKVVAPDKEGYGYAYLYAFKHAKGKYIVIGDADDTYDFLEIPKLLKPLMNGEADIVIGSRFKGKIMKGAMPWLHRYIGNPILTWFLNFFYKAGVSDAHSGFRAFTRNALEKMVLTSHKMEFASEMIMEAMLRNLKVKEVPITYYPRRGGESKLNSWKDGWRHLKFMIINTPKHLYYIPGITLFSIGFIIILLMNISSIRIGKIVLGYNTIILSSMLVLIGYQLIFLGVYASIYLIERRSINPDKLTKFLVKNITLEKGLLIGLIIFIIGLTYSLTLLFNWINSGFQKIPAVNQSILSYTLIIIGIQTIFNSFYLSMIIGLKSKNLNK